MTTEHHMIDLPRLPAGGLAALLIGGLLLLGGCQPSSDTDGGRDNTGSENAAEAANQPAADEHNSQASNHPELVSPLAARAIVKQYYQDIDKGDFKSAYALWWGSKDSDVNASKKTFDGFKSSFKDTRSTQVAISTPGEMHGAAGSTYIDIPVSIETTLASGETEKSAGTYTMRRANDVQGASWAEKQWRIYAVELRTTQ